MKEAGILLAVVAGLVLFALALDAMIGWVMRLVF